MRVGGFEAGKASSQYKARCMGAGGGAGGQGPQGGSSNDGSTAKMFARHILFTAALLAAMLAFTAAEFIPITVQGIAPGAGLGDVVVLSDDVVFASAPSDVVEKVTCGTVYAFLKENGKWVSFAKIVPPVLAAQSLFGYALAVSENWVAVGSPLQTSTAGSVFLFQHGAFDFPYRSVINSGQQSQTKPDFFGAALALTRTELVVGSPGYSYNGMTDHGAAFVFRVSGNTWLPTETLAGNDQIESIAVGVAVGIMDNMILVASAGTLDSTGRLYIYTGSTLTASVNTINMERVRSVSISAADGDILVGVTADTDSATPGAVAVVRVVNGTWSTEQVISPSTKVNDGFGVSMARSGDYVVIGSDLITDDSGKYIGGGYLYTLVDVNNQYVYSDFFNPPEGAGFFGRSIAIYDHVVMFGTPADGDLLTGAVYVSTNALPAVIVTPPSNGDSLAEKILMGVAMVILVAVAVAVSILLLLSATGFLVLACVSIGGKKTRDQYRNLTESERDLMI